MKPVNSIWIVLLVLLALFVGGWQRQSSPTKWEYAIRFISRDEVTKADQIINEYGNNGWELVAVSTEGGGLMGMYHFKRPK